MKLMKYFYGALMIYRRYILNDSVNTLAYFHKDCKKFDNNNNKNSNNNNKSQ